MIQHNKFISSELPKFIIGMDMIVYYKDQQNITQLILIITSIFTLLENLPHNENEKNAFQLSRTIISNLLLFFTGNCTVQVSIYFLNDVISELVAQDAIEAELLISKRLKTENMLPEESHLSIQRQTKILKQCLIS